MDSVFIETQKFNKWWHYILMGFPLTATIVTTYFTLKTPQANPTSLYISTGLAALVTVWLFTIKLKTTIDNSKIIAHFFGVPFCKREILWSDIQTIDVIEYSPLMDYGGWGIRYSSSSGTCYNVAGKTGIKIIKKDGTAFLVGTQQKEEAIQIIKHYFKK